jgi:hypothetical protein
VDHWRAEAQFMINRQDEAFRRAPWGTWSDRWIPGVCKHRHVRCTHGDEINLRGGARRACLVCGRTLLGPLPDECFFTGSPHHP